MNITVYCGANAGKHPAYTDAARTIGQWIADKGNTLLYGGGRVGLMGITADKVLASGGQVIGVIPEFLWNLECGHRGITQMIHVDDMHTRKMTMIEKGDVFIALPGGLGTLEEISEVISWARLGKLEKPCILFNANGFYDAFESLLNRMVTDGFVTQVHRDNILITNDIDHIENFINQYQPAGILD